MAEQIHPYALHDGPQATAARQMLKMQIQEAFAVMEATHLAYTPELLGQLVVALATNQQTLVLKK
ncbi:MULTISPECIES: hypothetical protein [Ramlibacter]|uniref:Uncharacterized protein n=1 Tax=Ramlibacter aquaticus TaxID=2780094 RepID=A0ABR9SCU1_9BURK|nr:MULTISPECIES: hypothetical protein [Ramlibacter]MBE7939557.1 hypothetical protein [Ramlibacter aquaticus]